MRTHWLLTSAAYVCVEYVYTLVCDENGRYYADDHFEVTFDIANKVNFDYNFTKGCLQRSAWLWVSEQAINHYLNSVHDQWPYMTPPGHKEIRLSNISLLTHVLPEMEGSYNVAFNTIHKSDVIIDTIASQITSLSVVYSIVYSDADQRKHQSSASLAFVRGIHRWPMNSPHKGPVTRKMFPFDDVTMTLIIYSMLCYARWKNKFNL